MKYIYYVVIITLIYACTELTPQHLYDEDFILLSDQTSPNRRHRLLEYHFDHGAHGYSRIFWAIIPTNTDTTKIDLTDYILPDGYKAISWRSTGEAVIEKWEPYYSKDDGTVLNTGDMYLGIRIVVK